jgi:hypothetical protein
MATSKPLLSDLVAGEAHIPSNYIRPTYDRPNLHEVESFDGAIPLIDLQDLNGPNRSDIIQQIGVACRNYGFFQVNIYIYSVALISIDILHHNFFFFFT